MVRPRTDQRTPRSQTLPSSPTHSSSSSEFEFTISLSPRKSSAAADSSLCPADELFYKGQLLPLHLSPRLSMVHTLLLSSSSTSSSASIATTTASGRHSTSSSSRPSSVTDCDSSRPSSVTEDDGLKRLNTTTSSTYQHNQIKKSNKYFSLSRFSSVFRVKEPKTRVSDNLSGSSVKSVGVTAKEVFRKYLKKVKPLYEKLSSQKQQGKTSTTLSLSLKADGSVEERENAIPDKTKGDSNGSLMHSFSGNLRYPRKKGCVSSCPTSMRSSPNHSGILYRNGFPGVNPVRDSSSMEELQSAIQGAIAHCKNSLVENKSIVGSNEI